MLKEATELTFKVKTTEKEWKEFTNEAKGALDSSRVALESPMPTLYTTNLPTGATATPNSQLLGGPGFDGAAFESVRAAPPSTHMCLLLQRSCRAASSRPLLPLCSAPRRPRSSWRRR